MFYGIYLLFLWAEIYYSNEYVMYILFFTKNIIHIDKLKDVFKEMLFFSPNPQLIKL